MKRNYHTGTRNTAHSFYILLRFFI